MPRGSGARSEAIAAALQRLGDQLSALSEAVQTISVKLDAALPAGHSRLRDPGDAMLHGAAVPSPAPPSAAAQAAPEEPEPGVPDHEAEPHTSG